jgi:hypothetical protein
LINNRQAGRRRGRGGQQRPNNQGGRNPEQGNRIDNRARGNASQLHEKYKTLARDAQMQGDRVNSEYYLQFADHYFRVLSESRARFDEQNQNQQRRQRDDDDGDQDEGDLRADDNRGNGDNRGDQHRQGYDDDGDGDQDDNRTAAAQRDEQSDDRRPRRQPRQPRRPRDDDDRQAETFDAAILPPAIARDAAPGSDAGPSDDDAEAAPRRRTRRPRAAAAEGDTTAQA